MLFLKSYFQFEKITNIEKKINEKNKEEFRYD